MLTQTHLESEILKRRTFAIISHPDAGKTTLTEKLFSIPMFSTPPAWYRVGKGGKGPTPIG